MRYVIMCGGYYEQWVTPKQLQIVNGEKIVERTIRLLKENGVKYICISSNDERFKDLGVEVLEHENSYRFENGVLNGYWLDAFYPNFRKNQKVTFIFGDVYFTENAIKQIVECKEKGNILFGSKGATVEGKAWGEPFAYYVNDMGAFYNGIEAVKKLQDEGKTDRVPIVWELYRYLNGIDVNTHSVKEETYKVIDDGTDDADTPEKLEKIRSANEIKGNVFTVYSLNVIGGGEQFLYYLAKKYKDRDITVYYQKGDIQQIERLKKYARVIRYTGQKIKCKKAFLNFNLSFIDNIEAEEYYQIIHADYEKRNLTPKRTDIKFIAVSKSAAEAFKRQTGLECEVCYNPIDLDTDKPLILMSATRLGKGKGKDRIERLARMLDKASIKYLWFIFTNDADAIDNDNIVYCKPRLDIQSIMPIADYIVQLSDDEAYCYTTAEANTQGVPCLTTDLEVFKELNIQGEVINFKDIPKLQKIGVKWKAPADSWDELLTDDKSTYIPPKEEKSVSVLVTRNYTDILTGKSQKIGDRLKVTAGRAKQLVDRKVAKYEG